MKKLIRRYRKWKNWKRYNCNGRVHHILVLLGLRRSVTFEQWRYNGER